MQLLLALALSLAAIANPPADAPPGWRSALPLWTLSTQAHAAVYTACHGTDAAVAVIDLRTGDRWIAGSQTLRPIRSVVKAPIALLSLLHAEATDAPDAAGTDQPTARPDSAATDSDSEQDELLAQDADEAADKDAGEDADDAQPPQPQPFNLDRSLADAVIFGDNAAATALLRRAGNMPALRDLYRRLGLPRLAEQAASELWGLGQANAADLADLAAALARSPEIPEPVRSRLLHLLIATAPSQRWGIIDAPPEHWTIAVRTGFWPDPERGQALNSIALWIPNTGQPRYAAAIMLQDRSPERLEAWTCQQSIAQPLGRALHHRAFDPSR